MQQTKRRSKKGVILLALALALFVLAILPAAAMATVTWSVNGYGQPGVVPAGTNVVVVKYSSDNPAAKFVSFEVTLAGPGAWQTPFPSPRKPYVPGSTDTEDISLGLGLTSGQMFQVRVTFYDLASLGAVVDGPVTSGVITYTTDKSMSALDIDFYGAYGAYVPPPAGPFPTQPWADYSTTWFGPYYDAFGGAPYGDGAFLPSGLGRAVGDFYSWGALADSIVYDVDGTYHADLLLTGPDAFGRQIPLIGNPIPFYDATGILKEDGTPWVPVPITLKPPVSDGFHYVHHHSVATTGIGDLVPEQYTVFGWDSTPPRWTIPWMTGTVLSSKTWYGNAPIAWDALVSDNPGSGVTTATVRPEFDNNSMTTPGMFLGTTHLDWTWWQSKASGTLVPKANTTNPLSWVNSWDANNYANLNGNNSVDVSFNATDAVYNAGNVTKTLHFDLIAPHTTHVSDPVGATSFVWSPFWVNTDVKVTFNAMDPGFDNGNASGVAYTEYVIGSSTSTPPGQTAAGTQGGSVTITKNAPTGPVYLWFRSVDNAVPANKEVWQLIYVYIDKPDSSSALAATGPVLENDVPTWWITRDDTLDQLGASSAKGVVVPVLFNFSVWFDATDVNSGIGPDMIRWRILNWNGNPGEGFANWNQVTPDVGTLSNYSKEFDVHVNAADDGMYSLESKVSDRAGNLTELSTPLGIDTRPPVTEGAAGWINGLKPYVLTATDQSIGAGVAATIYRVSQSTPWLANEASGTVGTTLETAITLPGTPVQGAMYTIDFGSVDAALPYYYSATSKTAGVLDYPGPSYLYGNLEGTSWIWGPGWDTRDHWGFIGFTGYKTSSVKLDVTAPTVTAMDPKNGNWQTGPAVVNFSGKDVGAGYAYTEWKTSGSDWTKGEVASVGGDGEVTVTYHGVDKVGLMSADQTIVVKVASTHPTVTAKNASVKKGHKANFKFTVTAVTPMAARVIIEIRTKSGRTLSSHSYPNVTANAEAMRSFKINLKKGKYNIRISAIDEAGNAQTRRGSATLTVK